MGQETIRQAAKKLAEHLIYEDNPTDYGKPEPALLGSISLCDDVAYYINISDRILERLKVEKSFLVDISKYQIEFTYHYDHICIESVRFY